MVAPPSPRRLACVHLPALPLQLVLLAHPDWASDPVVVVEHERPEAKVLWANRAARQARIDRGQPFRAAEALVPRLHAAVVAKDELDSARTTLLQLLLQFSPAIEPLAEAGHFVVDASGLHELFTGLEAWAAGLHAALKARGFVAAVVVGFQRFATGAIARCRPGWLVLRDAEHERELAAAVPCASLPLPQVLRQQLQSLAIHTLGEFLALPPSGLARRLGSAAQQLRTAATAPSAPLAAVVPPEPVRFHHDFELADADLERFLCAIETGLDAALPQLAARRQAAAALSLWLRLEQAPERHERLAAAAPTTDRRQLLELVRLRFEQTPLLGPIAAFTAEVEGAVVPRAQLALFHDARPQNLAAADRALARLAAAFGEQAVVKARLVDAHLPEQSFAFEPLRNLVPPRAAPAPAPTAAPDTAAPFVLVRALCTPPEPLGNLPVHEPETWLGEHGAVRTAHGPFRLRHGWWQTPVERDYFFVETDRGALLWVFHDRRARRWYLQGRVD
jgi:protein ImuB